MSDFPSGIASNKEIGRFTVSQNGETPLAVSYGLEFGAQSLCHVWLLQIRPPNTQPLILSAVPESVALPE